MNATYLQCVRTPSFALGVTVILTGCGSSLQENVTYEDTGGHTVRFSQGTAYYSSCGGVSLQYSFDSSKGAYHVDWSDCRPGSRCAQSGCSDQGGEDFKADSSDIIVGFKGDRYFRVGSADYQKMVAYRQTLMVERQRELVSQQEALHNSVVQAAQDLADTIDRIASITDSPLSDQSAYLRQNANALSAKQVVQTAGGIQSLCILLHYGNMPESLYQVQPMIQDWFDRHENDLDQATQAGF